MNKFKSALRMQHHTVHERDQKSVSDGAHRERPHKPRCSKSWIAEDGDDEHSTYNVDESEEDPDTYNYEYEDD